MALTDVKIRNTKPGAKPIKLSDSEGMYLLINPGGGKYWRLKYRFEGKEKVLALGTYPQVPLAEARDLMRAARKELRNGVDPGAARRAQRFAREQREANSFEIVAREWWERFKPTWTEGHAQTILARLEQNVFPWLGGIAIGEIEAPDLLAVLRRIEARGALETTHRVKTICGQVFRYAIATGRAKRDVAADLKGAIPPAKGRNHAAITEPKEVAPLLRDIDAYQGGFVVRCALRLAPLVFVRPGELRQAEWSEIDFEAEQWNIPAQRMKTKMPHIVPLSTQALDILKELQPYSGTSRYLFPSGRSFDRCMSENTVNAALRRMGYDGDVMTGHGFRAMARTILDEVLQIRPDYIEQQLAHALRDPNGRAYNRTAHIAERRKMMQTWADYLDGLKAGAKVLPFRKDSATPT